jgi:prefoldin subunit 5
MENIELKGKETINLIEKIKNGEKKILVPICDELAYIDCEILNNEKCKVHLGEEFYVETNFSKAIEIVKRKVKEEMKNSSKVNKLDDKTFEILEHYDDEEEKKKEEQKEKDNENNKKEKETLIEKNKRILEELTNYNPKGEIKIYKEIKLLPGKDIIRKIYNKLKL